ncbi:GNAT family N-acetyltransferase [Neobacillus sp. D3-1R]|uniref:GNAT family N-acetyltransferase n=1 Tax=Neobacillus sp. D3-1R TaxID=3445778 RepID=UPI003FA12604
MNNITFKNIYKPGKPVFENDLYLHNHNPEMLLQYDSNFLAFKKMPTVPEFEEALAYLKDYHSKHGQKHVRFYFPEGETLSSELTDYLINEKFTIGFLELFAIQPSQFPEVEAHPDMEMKKVTDETIDLFLQFKLEQDAEFGNHYAEQKQAEHLRNFKREHIQQFIAFYQGKLVGSVDVIISEHTAEIDSFMVLEDYQKKGIGSRLQKYVMDQFLDKTIILVADGEDTAKDMYRKQNYQYLGFQYEALKVYE